MAKCQGVNFIALMAVEDKATARAFQFIQRDAFMLGHVAKAGKTLNAGVAFHVTA